MAGCDWRIERGAAARGLAGAGAGGAGERRARGRRRLRRGSRRSEALARTRSEASVMSVWKARAVRTARAPADTTLIRLLVRGQKIAKRTFESNCPPLEAIAHEERITASYVTRLVRLAFLAPDIVSRDPCREATAWAHCQHADGRHASSPPLAVSASRAGIRGWCPAWWCSSAGASRSRSALPIAP